MSEHVQPAYIAVKTTCAPKLGRNGGGITYKVLTDTERQHLFLTIVGNDGGGYYSREIVAFNGVEACLPLDRAQPIAAKMFAPAFAGRSSNNAGFMAAILRAEGLLTGVEGKPNQHQVAGDWAAWKAALIDLPGESYAPVATEMGATAVTAEMTRQELPGDVDAESHPGHRKGKKLRVAKADEGANHAHPAR